MTVSKAQERDGESEESPLALLMAAGCVIWGKRLKIQN